MDRMLFPQLRLCLATGVEKWKEKSVTQRYPAASFNSAPIYTFWEHQSRSLSESNRSKKRGTQKGWTFRSPFKLDIKNWLSRGPVQLSDAWIMHFFQGVIGLICSCYLTTQSFMGFYHLLYISNSIPVSQLVSLKKLHTLIIKIFLLTLWMYGTMKWIRGWYLQRRRWRSIMRWI